MGAFRFTAALLLCTFVAAFLTSLGHGVERRLGAYLVLWPQEWSFFTELDQDTLVAYRFGEDDALGGQAGGLGRAADAYLSEPRRIAVRIPQGYWQPCGRPRPSECAADRASVLRAENPSRHPHLCGPVVIAVERVAFTRSRDLPRRLVHQFAVVDLRCG